MNAKEEGRTGENAPVWEVVLRHEQTATVYVQAATEKEAKEAAVEVVESYDWTTEYGEEEARTVEASVPHRYWSGGPMGDWVVPS